MVPQKTAALYQEVLARYLHLLTKPTLLIPEKAIYFQRNIILGILTFFSSMRNFAHHFSFLLIKKETVSCISYCISAECSGIVHVHVFGKVNLQY